MNGRLVAMIAATAWILMGCASVVEERFVAAPPTGAAGASVDPIPADAVRIERLVDVDVEAVRAERFPGARVLGRSRYVLEAESDKAVRKFAASIGSDVVLWSQRYDRKRIDPVPSGGAVRTMPGPNGTLMPVRAPRVQTQAVYEHELVFLRAEE